MWVFGYGSLMTDGWESQFDCTHRDVAQLQGYRRTFNKASSVNWGSRAFPCPTLNLEPHPDGQCVGIAFGIPDTRRASVEAYLQKREGKGFELTKLEILIRGKELVVALVPIYRGRNILSMAATPESLHSIARAYGTSGSCSEYIVSVHDQLTKLGIEDDAVTHFREIVKPLSQKGRGLGD